MTFEQIYHEYKNLVYNLSLQYTNNVHDAEEILQDVFLKVFDHLGEFRSTADMKTWIYRIAVNQSLDFIKSQQRKKRSFLNQLLRIDPNEQAGYRFWK